MVEVVLQFSPATMDPTGPVVTIGRTHAPAALRAVRDALLAEAQAAARYWRRIDPVLGEVRAAESARVEHLLGMVLPDDSLEPDLRLVDGEEEGYQP